MAGTTPVYGLRYPELVDPPDGAAATKNLADDVEAEIQRVDSTLGPLAESASAGLSFGVFCSEAGSSRVTRRGDIVHVNVEVSVSGGSVPATGVPAVVPAGYRPPVPWRGVLMSYNTAAPVMVTYREDGTIVADHIMPDGQAFYGSISYPLS